MRTVEEQAADLARITADELERRADRLITRCQALRNEAARLMEIVATPAPMERAPEPPAPIVAPEEPEEVLEEPRALKAPSSVGRHGMVTLEIAKARAQDMGEFERNEFCDRLGLKSSATMRWISLLIEEKVIRYREGRYICLNPPSMHHWVIHQKEPFSVQDAARVTRVTEEEAVELLTDLEGRGIVQHVNGSGTYEYVAPGHHLSPREHPHRTPPEKTPPNYSEARATGEPVRRSAANKVTRRQRSTEGAGGIKGHKQRDRRYKEMQEAKAKRAAEQSAKDKASYQPKGGRKKPKSIPV